LLVTDPLRVGVVGLGRLGRIHAENIKNRTRALELVRVADTLEEVARSAAAQLDVPWSTHFDDVLCDAEVDAVVIVTPTPLHASMIEQASAAGKHIFCEKPIAQDIESAKQAVEAAQRSGVQLQLGFHRRFDPDWAAAMRRIEAGELGQIYFFRSTLRDMEPPSLDFLRDSGGIFFDMMIHDFDVARWMVGEVIEITACGAAIADPRVAEFNDVDQGIAVLRFANGALGVIDVSRSAGYGYECATEIVGSRATVRIAHGQRFNVEWLTPGASTTDYAAGFLERFPQAYLLELEDFAAAVRDGRPVRVNGHDGIGALNLAIAADRSRAEKRAVPVAPIQ
jgi:inositol 2-dehydrogenase